MEDNANSLTIGGLAKAAGVGVETIRYYQRRSLLPEPERPPGGIRRYGPVEIGRLTFIKTAQQLGFSLDEIGDLLRLDDGTHCQEASALAEHKLRDVREKIDRLQRIESALSDVINRCHAHEGDITCPLISSLHGGIQQLNTAMGPSCKDIKPD
ncbi:Hg(II)-responsive transcriptional regulator [Halomonas elongata]|uniref:Hg(II)-responsive transcriptional regulator n=1 Tax=Halomonas elongata TaxID=2746 RepID=UPI0023B1D240|nr:Hg(II)-responsive transcriptional regulator [Halomonas elongata]